MDYRNKCFDICKLYVLHFYQNPIFKVNNYVYMISPRFYSCTLVSTISDEVEDDGITIKDGQQEEIHTYSVRQTMNF